jgi:trehalose/maltose hydrolase-like predicted phosphorylase
MNTYAAAPFPFETEVVVMPPGGGPIFRLSEASPPRPSSRMSQSSFHGSNMSSYVTCLNQTLDMATGELTTHIRIAPPSGSSWSLDLSVLQFLSRDIPSLGVQQIVATAKPSSLHYVLQPHITSDGLSETAHRYYNTIPIRSHWGEGPAYGIAMRTNTNSEVALGVETMCDNNTVPTDYKLSQAQGCDSSNLKGRQQGSGELSMTSFVSIVSDVYHARPSVAALELAHKGMYIGFDRLQARNRAVWRESWCVAHNSETVMQPS